MIHRKRDSAPGAEASKAEGAAGATAVEVDAPLHVFDQTNGILGKVDDAPGPETPDHSARNGLTAGAVMNPGGGF